MAGLDGLVNAAGILQVLQFDATKLSDWENVIRVNLTGPWIVCQAALRSLRAASGATIVNIATGLALRPAANYSSYIASKSGLLGVNEVACNRARPGDPRERGLSGSSRHTHDRRTLSRRKSQGRSRFQLCAEKARHPVGGGRSRTISDRARIRFHHRRLTGCGRRA